MDLNLKDKVAIVTGGASGIGKATAAELVREGADVVIADLNHKLSLETKRELERPGRTVIAVEVDVRVKKSVQKMAEHAVKSLGRVDILVNNAGLTKIEPLLDTSEENWDLVVDTILKGTFLCSQAVAETMIGQRSGCIINISSMCGIQGWPEREAYGSAKAGVNNLTRILAAELGPYGIRVNCIAPGYVMTEQIKGLIDDGSLDIKTLQKGVPLGKMASAADIAYAVAFLSSDKARVITGAVIVVDGGWTSSGAAWQIPPSKMKAKRRLPLSSR